MGDVEIAEIFSSNFYKEKGWSHKHIEKKRRYLCLRRTSKQIEKIKKHNIEQGRYSINHWKRWFGRTTPVGETRVWFSHSGRPYMVIKTKNGFVHYAQWLYRKEHGPIPRGCVVFLSDGNPFNVTKENLIAIPRREVCNRSINSDHRIASWITRDRDLQKELLKNKPLIDLKRTQLLLRRRINNAQTSYR